MRRVYLPTILFFFATTALAQQAGEDNAPQNVTFYPPMVYMGIFQGCSADKPCTKTDSFTVDSIPKGCCILQVTNGDGKGAGEARSYEIFLNDGEVASLNNSPSTGVKIRILRNNKVKVVLTGEPSSRMWVLISYDPRQPN